MRKHWSQIRKQLGEVIGDRMLMIIPCKDECIKCIRSQHYATQPNNAPIERMGIYMLLAGLMANSEPRVGSWVQNRYNLKIEWPVYDFHILDSLDLMSKIDA